MGAPVRKWLLVSFVVPVAIEGGACVGDSSITTDGGNDGASDVTTDQTADVSTNDAADAAQPQCDVSKPFGAPTAVTELDTTGNEQELRLSSDYLGGFFVAAGADGGGALSLYESVRPSLTSPFGARQPLSSIASDAGSESYPSIVSNGLSLFFALGGNIVTASRATTAAAFANVAPVQGVNTTSDDEDPFIREDGTVLYWVSNVGGNYDIYRATNGGSGFGTPALVTEINSASVEASPTVTPDDLVIYFASSRPDGGAKGIQDIWVASRTSVNDPFGTPTNVAELNTANYERPSFITRDRCTIYINRTIGTTNVIYVATRSP